MAAEHYRLLVDQICAHTLIPNPAALYHATNLTVRDIDFSLSYLDGPGQGVVSVLCDFGPLPARLREEVLLRLLETNFYMADTPGAPMLSFNDQTQRVILACRLALESIDVEALLALLGQFADMASLWRTDHFLATSSAATRIPGQASAGLSARLGAPS